MTRSSTLVLEVFPVTALSGASSSQAPHEGNGQAVAHSQVEEGRTEVSSEALPGKVTTEGVVAAPRTFEQLEFRAEQLLEAVVAVIKRIRAELGVSQRELASRAGVAQSSVCDIENGSVNPTWTVLAKLCLALGTTLEQVVLEATFQDRELTPSQRKALKTIVSLLTDDGTED